MRRYEWPYSIEFCGHAVATPCFEMRDRGDTNMKRLELKAAIGVLTLALAAAHAQQAASLAPATSPVDYSTVVIKTTDLGGRTYMLEGRGGNMTLAIGTDGGILVDSEFAPLHDKIAAAIATVSNVPVRYLVDTHFHGDHSGGNEAFARGGTVVVADVNVKTRLENGSVSAISGLKTPPAPVGALPTRTYTDALTLDVGGRAAQLKHFPNAHTDGDT